MNPTDNSIPEVLKRELENQRDALNRLYRSRLALGTKIDAKHFTEHVRTRIGGILTAVDAVLPERTRLALSELFEVSLELFAAGHFGEETRTPHLSSLWESLFPKIAKPLARAPRRVAGCLSNAVVQIEQQSPVSAERWIRLVAQAGAYTESVDELLVLGKVAAWISGMAHYRSSALAAASSIPTQAMASLLGLDPGSDGIMVRDCLTQLQQSPWYTVNTSQRTHGTVKQVAQCGAFRGFGGTLIKPPTVATIDEKLMVSDGQHVWQIFADRFGAVTQRVDAEPFRGKLGLSKSNPRIAADGTIKWDKATIVRADLANANSVAFDGTTLAVTIPTSFHVYLFAQVSADQVSVAQVSVTQVSADAKP